MKKTIPPRTKFSFSLEIFILGLKISFSLENVNPRPCFSAAGKGPGMKISFSIENFILYWKLDSFQYCLSRLNFFNPGALWEFPKANEIAQNIYEVLFAFRTPNPKNLSSAPYIGTFYLGQGKNEPCKVQITSRDVNFMLVLKGIFGGSPCKE